MTCFRRVLFLSVFVFVCIPILLSREVFEFVTRLRSVETRQIRDNLACLQHSANTTIFLFESMVSGTNTNCEPRRVDVTFLPTVNGTLVGVVRHAIGIDNDNSLRYAHMANVTIPAQVVQGFWRKLQTALWKPGILSPDVIVSAQYPYRLLEIRPAKDNYNNCSTMFHFSDSHSHQWSGTLNNIEYHTARTSRALVDAFSMLQNYIRMDLRRKALDDCHLGYLKDVEAGLRAEQNKSNIREFTF